MLFLICLDPLLNKRVKANYQEHTNEDVYKFNNNTKSFSVNSNSNSSISNCRRTNSLISDNESENDSDSDYFRNIKDRERMKLLA